MNIQFDKSIPQATMKRKIEPATRKRDASVAEDAKVTTADDSKNPINSASANYADGATLLRKSHAGSVQSFERLISEENSASQKQDRRGMIIDILA